MIAVMVVVALLLPVDAFAETERDPPSAETAIAGALVNVKSRYRAKLDHYGLPNRTSTRQAEYAI